MLLMNKNKSKNNSKNKNKNTNTNTNTNTKEISTQTNIDVKPHQSPLPRNIVREFFQSIPTTWKEWLGHYYIGMHNWIIALGCFVFFFSNHIGYLLALLNMIILDCMSIVFLHDCPLTMLFKHKYCGKTREFFQKSRHCLSM